MVVSAPLVEEVPVKAYNKTKQEVVLKWANVRHRIPPGGMNFVPFMAMARHAGNPHSSATTNPSRRQEFDRLQMFYGGEATPDLLPLEFFTLDDDRITTVLEDPEGRHLMPIGNNQSEMDFMREQMTRMAKQLTDMQTQYETAIRSGISEDMGADVGEDRPKSSVPAVPRVHQANPEIPGGAIPGLDGSVSTFNNEPIGDIIPGGSGLDEDGDFDPFAITDDTTGQQVSPSDPTDANTDSSDSVTDIGDPSTDGVVIPQGGGEDSPNVPPTGPSPAPGGTRKVVKK